MTGLVAVVCVCVTVLAGGRYVVDAWRSARHAEVNTWERVRFAERGIEERAHIDTRRQHELDREIEARRVAVEERRLQLEEKRHTSAPRATPMPPDLAARPAMWDDQFMQEQERSTIQALYAEYGDWEAVRRHLTPLSPFLPTEIVAPSEAV